MTTHEFRHTKAVRSRVPLLCGLTGASSSGKSKSALRLASGMASVDGRRVFYLDTEANRALHYADEHDFDHIPFPPPFSPARYVAAINYCIEQGAGVVVIDSCSHIWDGIGGVIDMHDQELDRMAGDDWKKRKALNMLAWSKPKAQYARFVQTLLISPAHFVICLRAKEKNKMPDKRKGESDVTPLGYMPIIHKDFAFELTINALLMPNSRGVPSWNPEEAGERSIVKTSEWAERIHGNRQIDEQMGIELAKWAAGTKPRSLDEILAELDTCRDPATLGTLRTDAKIAWRSLGKADQQRVKAAIDAATKRIEDSRAEPSDANEDA